MRVMPLLLMGTLMPSLASAAELVAVLPLTDRIVMLHFDEGYVIHHKRGEPRHNEQVMINPLDVDQATKTSSYQIASSDDPAYAQAQQPTQLARKSKGTDFAWFFDDWKEGVGVINNRPDHTKEHWIYLSLPEPMQSGKTYTITTGELAKNGNSWQLKYDENNARSEAVHVNLIGYSPAAPKKFAYVYHWMGDAGPLDVKPYDGHEFRLVDQKTGKPAFRGQIAFRKPKTQQETDQLTDTPNANFSGADVYECDFSLFNRPGKYVVAVDGIGCSFPFEIKDDVYRDVFIPTARGLYHNRSGIALTKPYTEFERPAPHNPKITPGFKDQLIYTKVRFMEWGSEGGDAKALKAESPGPIETSGWYQDAGDWDSYFTHMRVATELLIAYHLAPKNFKDSELNIPESGNGIPDILDEAAWLPRFCYRLRHELMDKKYGTGGVGLRIAGDAFGSDEKVLPDGKRVGQGSWEDVRIYAASGEDPWSTYRYSAAAAHLAYLLKRSGLSDPENVDWAKEAAEAYEWSAKNTRPGDEDKGLAQHRTYAAAALFLLTADKKYEEQLERDWKDVRPNSEFFHESFYGPALYAIAGMTREVDKELYNRIRAAVLATADHIAIRSPERRALRWGGIFSFPMLIGHQTTPWVLEGAVGYRLTQRTDPKKAEAYLASLYTTCDYFLGTNSLNMTFITGVGPRHPQHPFHMDAWYNGKPTAHPGIIPYGHWRDEGNDTNPTATGWPHRTVHPLIAQWPGNERFWDNRCSPLTSEFTVHQNTGPAAAMYGLLCAPGLAAHDELELAKPTTQPVKKADQ